MTDDLFPEYKLEIDEQTIVLTPVSVKLTSADIVKALFKRHDKLFQWVSVSEICCGFGDGYTSNAVVFNDELKKHERIQQSAYLQRIDFFAMDCFQSHKYNRYAYEIKISRSDFLNDIKQSHKQVNAHAVSNYFYWVCPKGLIQKHEIPNGDGLMYVDIDNPNNWIDGKTNVHYKTRIVHQATRRDVGDMPIGFVAQLLRRIQEMNHNHLSVWGK